jgi:hypothetical protein
MSSNFARGPDNTCLFEPLKPLDLSEIHSAMMTTWTPMLVVKSLDPSLELLATVWTFPYRVCGLPRRYQRPHDRALLGGLQRQLISVG